ncbi:cytochrome P450 [Streptomyces sp. SID14515]|uniref:cytochrome P450 n=1 Tax=Streptomyces sp. SID14515 TaxID=2706074 RepID=UPI0013C566AB|nr:cytochrome P450 [Streptomyces sp. SID14515]NEB40846.1 cytochrome P450 [Streptomyces sp. SID14515]NEB42172.1 cytochrome P450 [Streptomyces sp. SID14515]
MTDLADPELPRSGRTEEIWKELREQSPLYRNERANGPAFWAVLSHPLANQVLRDSANFTSEKGMRLDHNPLATEASAGKMLIVTDPPRHGKIRRIINSAFTPRMVKRLEDTMRSTVVETLEEALEKGTSDFVDAAARLPVSVICDMLGVPKEDWGFMLDRTMIAFGSDAVDGGEDQAMRAAAAHTDLLMYYDELVELRREDPQEDVVSAMVQGEVDGEPLTDEEIFLNCDGLISGGNETTRHATVGGLLALMDHPDQWDRLRADPGLLPSTVQEVLRYTSPAMHVLRTANQDTELEGRAIAAGDEVAVWLSAANRDGQVFENPDAFDVGRSPNRHLTFASGTHFCLGSALATMELSVMFEELTRRVGAAGHAGPVQRMRSNLIWGFESMPVALGRRG